MYTDRDRHNPCVFLCYRRNDTSAVTGRLSDLLRSRFGTSNVFLDIDEIAYGNDIRESIRESISAADVVLVLIGERWFEDDRLQDRFDYVRMEIEFAFASNRTIIPVLVDDAQIPKAIDLPESIRQLADIYAPRLTRDNFRDDVELIIQAMARAPRREPVDTTAMADSVASAIAQPRRLIFVSYAHEDTEWLDRVKVHLKPLARQGRIELWDDSHIPVGTVWSHEIKIALDACVAAVLIVSAYFMASDFINENELPPLLEAAETRGVQVLPILVSSSSYAHSDLARFRALNPPTSPLDMISRGEQEATLSRLHDIIMPLVVQ